MIRSGGWGGCVLVCGFVGQARGVDLCYGSLSCIASLQMKTFAA